jgi:hypothetical protein
MIDAGERLTAQIMSNWQNLVPDVHELSATVNHIDQAVSTAFIYEFVEYSVYWQESAGSNNIKCAYDHLNATKPIETSTSSHHRLPSLIESWRPGRNILPILSYHDSKMG